MTFESLPEEEEKKDNDNNILSDSEYEYVDDGNVIEQKDILDEIDFEEGGNEEENGEDT